MNVLGIGIDIVENARIRGIMERHGAHFLERVFTPVEREYCGVMKDPAPFYAARFAAKEAVAKAFGTGIGADISWLDMEVQRAASGKPSILLRGAGADLARRMGVSEVLITLSHSEHYAVAQAMLISA
ncbi:MAG: holo-[acyl-carrier-protein] synthase [Verrucomicrobiaceae bacterium]|nr:MAG: holo-[acyl-carrier-protein] synthase [Verrucomicrobiaceae bacterium]